MRCVAAQALYIAREINQAASIGLIEAQINNNFTVIDFVLTKLAECDNPKITAAAPLPALSISAPSAVTGRDKQ